MALPILRALRRRLGPMAVIHFDDFSVEAPLGFTTVQCADFDRERAATVADRVVNRVGAGTPTQISIDIDVLYPSAAPGTGTPTEGVAAANLGVRIKRGVST